MIGQTISHYKILDMLGEGGMGVVYRAEDTKLKRSVALKFLPSSLLVNEDDRRRFVHEAQASAALSHANIATVFEIDESGAQTFIALEYIEGQSLAEKIKSGPMKLDEAISIAIQTCEGLQAAHEKGIVHRDIKSQNIMVTTKGQVKILDFGLAKLRGASVVTKTGTTVGTMGYMSPEQLRGEAVDHRTDLWAVGVVLYEMIAGRRPFQGDYDEAISYQITNQQPEPLTSIRTGVPMELERIVNKLLAKNVSGRYQGTTDLIVDLRTLKRTSDSGFTPAVAPGVSPFGKRKWVVPVATASLFVFVLIGYFVIFQRTASSHQIRTIAVLPLKSLSQQSDQEYVTEGMQMALINELSKVRSLTIISSQSSSRFKSSDKSAREIAAALGADALLGGSALLDGNTIRVSLQLVDGQSDKTVWADQYDKAYGNILALHSEVARNVTDKIKINLTQEEVQSLAGGSSVDPKAYDAYQRGVHLWKESTPESIRKAREYFEEAVSLDPRFAPAHAWLSTVYLDLGTWVIPPSDRASRQDAIAKGRLSAKKALELDNSSSDAHANLATYFRDVDWNIEAAEKEFKEAIRLNPSDPQAHHGYSYTLALLGKNDDALANARRAEELDPLYWGRSDNTTWMLIYAGRYDEALAQARKMLELDGASMGAWMTMGHAYDAKGLKKDAMLAWARAHELNGNTELAKAYRELPFNAALQKWLDQSQGPRGPVYNNLTVSALANEMMGNRAEAVRWLERALQYHDANLLNILIGYQWKDARSDPRVKSIIKRMGLEQYAKK